MLEIVRNYVIRQNCTEKSVVKHVTHRVIFRTTIEKPFFVQKRMGKVRKNFFSRDLIFEKISAGIPLDVRAFAQRR